MFFSRKKDVREDTVSAGQFAELVQRVKMAERELEDLHACYRRLRAASGGEKRVENAQRRDNGGEEAPPMNRKDTLRARVGLAQRVLGIPR